MPRPVRRRWRLGPLAAFGQGKPILLGSVLDNSGNLDIYGKPMVMATTMAVEELNAAGGLVGRQIKAIQYDTHRISRCTPSSPSSLRAPTRWMSCTGASPRHRARRSARPSGAPTCCTSTTCCTKAACAIATAWSPARPPAQAVEPIVDYAMKKWGKKVYILAADYNYGQITAKWLQHYIAQRGGSVASTDFFPLDVADFGSTIAKIQQANPDWVVSALVGGAHMAYYPAMGGPGHAQEDPAGLHLGVGNEHLALSPAEGDGIIIAGNYSQEANTPANKEFLARWQKRFGDTGIVRDRGVAVPGHLHVGGVRQEGRQGSACCDPVGPLHRGAGGHGDDRAEDAARCPGHPPDGGEEPEAHHPQHRQAAPAVGHPAVLRSDQEPERE